jgi:hypothetical protein
LHGRHSRASDRPNSEEFHRVLEELAGLDLEEFGQGQDVLLLEGLTSGDLVGQAVPVDA